MKKHILWRANAVVCLVIILGYILISVISCHSNKGIFQQDIEQITTLTSEGIYHEIDAVFTKPINISLTMANDSLLKSFLTEEEQRMDDPEFLREMQQYLLAYRQKYQYDSVFLVSTETGRYYHFNGIDRILNPDEPEDVWYYSFLESGEEYALSIDNDQAADNAITVFVNCRIRDAAGDTRGVVGVGFEVDSFQQLLKEYEEKFNLLTYLVGKDGVIEISTTWNAYQRQDFFDQYRTPGLEKEVISDQEARHSLWFAEQGAERFLISRYVPNLEWFLVVVNDSSELRARLDGQFWGGIAIAFLVVGIVLLTITRIMRKYNEKIIRLTIAREQEHQTVFQESTEKLYENIYELDITHNRAASEATEAYFESLGVPPDTPFDKALGIIAQKQIKEEYRQGYIDTFSPENVLRAYENGVDMLQYDFMISSNGSDYYWMRITTRIFFWEEDQSIRMFAYRKNIDEQKRQERYLFETMRRDSLSGLYNKAATQSSIRDMLSKKDFPLYAFFILDIDDFKLVNDTYGHAVGDCVIADFAGMLKRQFREDDIIGRIGGDEFAVFLPVPSREWAEERAEELVKVLRYTYSDGFNTCKLSSSVGAAVYPDDGTDFETLYKNADAALYKAKRGGKSRYAIYETGI